MRHLRQSEWPVLGGSGAAGWGQKKRTISGWSQSGVGGGGNDILLGNADDDDLRGGVGIDDCDRGNGTDVAKGCEDVTGIP